MALRLAWGQPTAADADADRRDPVGHSGQLAGANIRGLGAPMRLLRRPSPVAGSCCAQGNGRCHRGYQHGAGLSELQPGQGPPGGTELVAGAARVVGIPRAAAQGVDGRPQERGPGGPLSVKRSRSLVAAGTGRSFPRWQ